MKGSPDNRNHSIFFLKDLGKEVGEVCYVYPLAHEIVVDFNLTVMSANNLLQTPCRG